MSARFRSFAVALAFLGAGLVSVARAQDERRVGDVSVRVHSPWPASIGKGYVPVFVSLINESGRDRDVNLDLQAWGSWRTKKTGSRVVHLAPGESTQVELLAPSFLGSYGSNNNFSLTAIVAGKSQGFQLPAGSDGWSSATSSLLVVLPGKPDEVLRAELERDLELTGSPVPLDPGSNAKSAFRSLGIALDASVSLTNHEFLPRGFQGYTSLNAVLVDAREGLPEAEAIGPLLTWVRLGGTAVVVGTKALEQLGRMSSLEGAFEDRFRRVELPGGGLFSLGLGRLYVLGGSESLDLVGVDSSQVRKVVRDALLESSDNGGSAGGWVPTSKQWRLSLTGLAIPGLDSLPLRIFMVLLVAFAVLIGPVNLVFLKRIGRPALLLVTIPLLSGLASIGLLFYGIFYQGLDTKAARRSLTVLDQRSQQADTVERRRLFVGLSPGRGLRPGSATAVIPENVDEVEQSFAVDFDGGALLRGDFLPVRSEVTQMILSEQPARVHLVAQRDGQRIRVTNNLAQHLEALVLRDPDGGWYSLPGALDSGESAELETLDAVDGEEPERWAWTITGGEGMYRGLELPPGCYLARLEETAFSDECKLDLTVKDATHVVLGILPLDEGSWKR